MGRGNRGWTESHPDRHLWSPSEAQLARTMSQEAYEALYGRGPAASPGISSPLFPHFTEADALDFQRHTVSSERVRELLQKADFSRGDAEGDPVVELLLGNEWKRMEEEAKWWERNTGEAHWSTLADKDKISAAWIESAVHSGGKGPVLLSSAALLAGQRGTNEMFRDFMRLRLLDGETRAEYWKGYILPDVAFLARQPSELVSRHIWEGLSERAGVWWAEADIEAHALFLQSVIDKNLPEASAIFRDSPWASGASTSWHREALAILRPRGDVGEAEILSAANQLLVRQLQRISCGFGDPPEEVWADGDWMERQRNRHRKYLQELDQWKLEEIRHRWAPWRLRERPASPVEGLRVFWVAEEREEEFDSIVAEIDRRIASGPPIDFFDRIARGSYTKAASESRMCDALREAIL